MNRARQAFIEELLDMIRNLDIPENPGDPYPLRTLQRIDSVPFRALLEQLTDDDRRDISLAWLTFTNALNSARPTRHSLRMALMPLRKQLGLLDTLPSERLNEQVAREVAKRLSTALRSRSGDHVREIAEVMLDAERELEALPAVDFERLVDTVPLVRETGEFGPEELSGDVDDFALERDPATGFPVVPLDLYSAVEKLRFFADDLSTIARLKALQVLDADDSVDEAASATLTVLEQQPRVADVLRRLGANLQRWKRSDSSEREAWPERSTPVPTAPTLPLSNPWRTRFVVAACVAICAAVLSSVSVYQANRDRRRALAFQTEHAKRYAGDRDSTSSVVAMPASEVGTGQDLSPPIERRVDDITGDEPKDGSDLSVVSRSVLNGALEVHKPSSAPIATPKPLKEAKMKFGTDFKTLVIKGEGKDIYQLTLTKRIDKLPPIEEDNLNTKQTPTRWLYGVDLEEHDIRVSITDELSIVIGVFNP